MRKALTLLAGRALRSRTADRAKAHVRRQAERLARPFLRKAALAAAAGMCAALTLGGVSAAFGIILYQYAELNAALCCLLASVPSALCAAFCYLKLQNTASAEQNRPMRPETPRAPVSVKPLPAPAKKH